MRSIARRAIVLSSCLSAAVVWSGCEAKQATEYVTGISTQVTVPRDLKAVRVEVSVGGVPQFCRGYKVYDGKVQLPRSLGTYPNSDSALNSGPVTYTISGLSSDNLEDPFFAACTQARVSSDDVRIIRRSRQPYIKDEILFLPMPLTYACYDKICGDDETCKGGKCVSATLTDAELKLLPRYTPDLVDGTGATCFSRDACLPYQSPPAILVDASNCTYAVPSTPSAPPPLPGADNPIPPTGDGVNVEITYDGGLVREVLNLDPLEGFFIPDPQFPQRFRLAEGLCEMVKGVDANGDPTVHRITAVRTFGRCQPKRSTQPLCAPDQMKAMGLNPDGTIPDPPPKPVCKTFELKPPPAGLVVVVDNTVAHQKFFEALNKNVIDPTDEESLINPFLNGLLSDPVFQNTDLGMVYAPGKVSGNCGTNGGLDVSLAPMLADRDAILNGLKSLTLLPEPAKPDYEGALQRAYNALRADPKYFRRAVVVIGNNTFEGSCTDPPSANAVAAAAFADPAQPIRTYVMQLTTLPDKSLNADLLAVAGGTEVSAHKTDQAKTKFLEVIHSLATCVYEVSADGTEPGAGDTIAFANPLDGTVTNVAYNDLCKGEDVEGNGWGYADTAPAGKKRIHLCKSTCEAYRNVLRNTSAFTALYQQPPIAVPVFAYKAECP
jgi:hypothetical protein